MSRPLPGKSASHSESSSLRAKVQHDYLMKVILLGDSSVGKSSLLTRYCDDEFAQQLISTLSVDFKYKAIEVGGKQIQLQLWDTAGQERFISVTSAFFKRAQGAVIVYDCTNGTSFHNVKLWMERLKQHNSKENLQIIIVGNKCDLSTDQVVPREAGIQLAKQFHAYFLETSAKTAQNVSEAFRHLATEFLDTLQRERKEKGTVGDDDSDDYSNKKRGSLTLESSQQPIQNRQSNNSQSQGKCSYC